MDGIERFCDVSVSEIASHAVQLSGNQFQIMASRPTQLTIACTEGAKVETIQGVHLLTLTETCPKANTPDHFFVRNPHVVSSQQTYTTSVNPGCQGMAKRDQCYRPRCKSSRNL